MVRPFFYLFQASFGKRDQGNRFKGDRALPLEFIGKKTSLQFLVRSENLVCLLLNVKEVPKMFLERIEEAFSQSERFSPEVSVSGHGVFPESLQ